MRGCCEAPEQRGQVQEYGEQQQDVGEELESKSQLGQQQEAWKLSRLCQELLSSPFRRHASTPMSLMDTSLLPVHYCLFQYRTQS